MATSKSFETWIAGAFLYSGRADPTWPVSRGFAKRFENLWSMLPATEKAAPNPSRLGYRGAFLRVSLHQQWIAFGGVVSLETPLGIEVRADPERQFEKDLLASAPKGSLPADLSL
ncbi:MAG TPA: hypothetical protein VL156_08255 [Terriglobales bacterium]|jgi:hypothetical protein|nr:hypothetical protein [Terriglobales bacterium]